MGAQWDHGVPGVAYWQAILRVCKPGAMLLAFGGTRTVHRLTCAIEDAGWVIRDTLMWVYGSGFPKSLDISKAVDKAAGTDTTDDARWREADEGHNKRGPRRKRDSNIGQTAHHANARNPEGVRHLYVPDTDVAQQWSGYGTALKPAYEPVVLAMNPLDGTFAHNAERWGIAGLNVDGCRVGTEDTRSSATRKPGCQKYGGTNHRPHHDGAAGPTVHGSASGRFPANLLHDGSPEVLEVFARAGVSKSTGGQASLGAFRNGDVYGKGRDEREKRDPGLGDTGTAARFFYCAKSSRRERTAGGTIANGHPCIKPLALCTYLARLILPPERDTPRRLLVPFAGSGSEMIGALQAGWDAVDGIEMDPAHCETARARIAHHQAQAPLFAT